MVDGITYGRTYYGGVSSMVKVGRGFYRACRAGHTDYLIEGGRALGGTKREWLVARADDTKSYIRCTSVKDALRLIEQGF